MAGAKRVNFADFDPILKKAKGITGDTGCKEDYIEGLKVFDKDGSKKINCAEVKQVLCSLGTSFTVTNMIYLGQMISQCVLCVCAVYAQNVCRLSVRGQCDGEKKKSWHLQKRNNAKIWKKIGSFIKSREKMETFNQQLMSIRIIFFFLS